MKNITLGCLLHEDTHGFYPSGGWGRYWTGDPNQGYGENQPGSWQYNILTYIEEGTLHDLGNGLTAGSQAYKDAIQQLNTTPVGLFHCPTRRPARTYLASWNTTATELPNLDSISKTVGVAKSDYAANSGDSQLWSGDVGDGWVSPLSYTPPTTTWTKTSDCDATNRGRGSSFKWCQTGIMYYRSQTKVAQIIDGTTNTYLVGEKYLFPDAYDGVTSGQPGFTFGDNQGLFSGYEWDNHRVAYWPGVSAGTAEDYQPRQDTPRYDNYSAFGSAHTGGLNMGMCDGSVHFLSYDVDPTTHRYLANRLDGNVVSLEGAQ
ncbi:MAG: DUF1559 domain-containing protein [Planctomycetes bacterium]|nr:DUF1559 domain-containing protein [Planctomycetota bacterium]